MTCYNFIILPTIELCQILFRYLPPWYPIWSFAHTRIRDIFKGKLSIIKAVWNWYALNSLLGSTFIFAAIDTRIIAFFLFPFFAFIQYKIYFYIFVLVLVCIYKGKLMFTLQVWRRKQGYGIICQPMYFLISNIPLNNFVSVNATGSFLINSNRGKRSFHPRAWNSN